MSEQLRPNVINVAVSHSLPPSVVAREPGAVQEQSTLDGVSHRRPDLDGVKAATTIAWSAPLALPHRVNVLGVEISSMTLDELHQQIAYTIQTDKKRLVLNANVHCINLCFKHNWLPKFLNRAPIVFCDGSGVMVGARLLGHDIPERITYADWTWQLAEFAAQKGFSIFCLGAKPHVIDKAVAALQTAQPDLQIAGAQHGYFDKRPGSAENQQVIELINRAQPDILLVGFGMPLQERWLQENWDAIDANIALTGGAVFDYISGELRRAPDWILRINMEWVGRLLIEPRRLATRYLIGNPLFLWRIVMEMVRQRFNRAE